MLCGLARVLVSAHGRFTVRLVQDQLICLECTLLVPSLIFLQYQLAVSGGGP